MSVAQETKTAIRGAIPSNSACTEIIDILNSVDDNTFDLNGAADGLILDADADTTISAPTDDQIDIELNSVDHIVMKGVASADAGVTRDIMEIAFTSPVDTTGTNTHNALTIDVEIGNATGGTNAVRGIQIDAITGDAQVTETAINIGSGWDSGITCASASSFTSTLGVTGAITPTGGVAAAGGFSASPCGQIHTGGNPAHASTDGTELTPTTTTVYTVEIFIPCNMTITGVRVFNGAAVDGNITVAMYTSAGTAIGAAALSAATAGSGTDAYQSIPFATPYAAVGPARYLLGFQYSNGAHRPNTHVLGTAFGIAQASATIGVTAISPLPSAFVTATQPIASLY